jgi:hypothetical protein
MNRLLLVGVIGGGLAGSWVADSLGFDATTMFLAASLGSLAGLYLAWKVVREFFGG